MVMELSREDVGLNQGHVRRDEECTILNTPISHCQSAHVTAEEQSENLNCTSESESEEA